MPARCRSLLLRRRTDSKLVDTSRTARRTQHEAANAATSASRAGSTGPSRPTSTPGSRTFAPAGRPPRGELGERGILREIWIRDALHRPRPDHGPEGAG